MHTCPHKRLHAHTHTLTQVMGFENYEKLPSSLQGLMGNGTDVQEQAAASTSDRVQVGSTSDSTSDRVQVGSTSDSTSDRVQAASTPDRVQAASTSDRVQAARASDRVQVGEM